MSDMLPPVVARLKANITDFQAGMAQAKGEMSAVGSTGAQSAKMIGKAFVVGGAIAGAALVAFGVKSAHTFQKVGTETLKLQKFTGQTAEEASRLRYAMQASGLSVDDATKSLTIFSKKVTGSKDGMRDFGFATRDSSGHVKPMNVLLGEAADHYNTLTNTVERTEWVTKTFGKSGMQMTKFLSLGSKGLMELSAEADKYGLTLTDQNLHAVKDAIRGHREQKAAMEGLQVQIGQHVLPALTKMTTFIATAIPASTKFITDHGTAFQVLGGIVGVVAAGFVVYKAAVVAQSIATGVATAATVVWTGVQAAAAAIAGVVSLGLDGVALSAMYAAEAMTTATVSSMGLATGLGIAAAGVVAFVATTKGLNNLIAYKGDAEALGKALRDLGSGAGTAQPVIDQLGGSVEHLATNFLLASKDSLAHRFMNPDDIVRTRKGINEIKALDKQLADMASKDPQAATATVRALTDALEAQGVSVEDVTGQLPQYADALHKANNAKEGSAAASKQEAEATAKAWDKLVMHKAAVDADWASLTKLQNLKMASLSGDIAYQQAIASETQALKDNGATLDLTTEKGRANQQAAMASRQAIMQQAQALKDNGATSQETARFINDHTRKLGEQEIAAGLSADQVKWLNTEMGMTPADVSTTMHVYTGGALTALGGLVTKFSEVANIIGQSIRVNVIGVATGAPGNARGTNNWRGGMTWVGEQGPELVELPKGSKVYPHAKSKSMAAQADASPSTRTAAGVSGGTVQNITVNAETNASPDAIAHSVGFAVRTLAAVS